MAHYDFYLIGSYSSSESRAVRDAISRCLQFAGVEQSDVGVYTRFDSNGKYHDGMRPIVVACFKDISENDMKVLDQLRNRRVPIIPLRRKRESFTDFPGEIQMLNGIEFRNERKFCNHIANSMLDAVGLLREQRRIFISYRRTEATDVAIQLFNHLSASGFEVFLDTHSIRPSVDFQESLRHHLCDSDVLVMLDTSTYFESRWTVEEFGQAQSSNIHILRLVWPNHEPTQSTALSETVELKLTDFKNGQLTDKVQDTVVEVTRNMRAKSIASRHTLLSGKLRAGVEHCGGRVVGVGAFRAIAVEVPRKPPIWVYPVVGVPTSYTMNNIVLRAKNSKHMKPFLIFDEFGISKPWLDHLEWLNERVPEVDLMRASDASNEISRR